MFAKLKQFKDLREKAKHLQSTLAQERAEGSSGWGKVKIVFDGNQRAVEVVIDQAVMSDQTKLQQLVKEAVNDGMEKVQKMMAAKLKDMGGLDLAKDLEGFMKS